MSRGGAGFISIDLETLGKWDSSIILSLGMTVVPNEFVITGDIDNDFTNLLSNSVEFKLGVMTQKRDGRTTDTSVLDWWKEQAANNPAAAAILKPSEQDIDYMNIFHEIDCWLYTNFKTKLKDYKIFDRNSFDVSKLQHLWEVTLNKGSNVPWSYKEVFEVVTLLRICSKNGDRYGDINPYEFSHPDFVYHSAKCDAALDALRIARVFKGLC